MLCFGSREALLPAEWPQGYAVISRDGILRFRVVMRALLSLPTTLSLPTGRHLSDGVWGGQVWAITSSYCIPAPSLLPRPRYTLQHRVMRVAIV